MRLFTIVKVANKWKIFAHTILHISSISTSFCFIISGEISNIIFTSYMEEPDAWLLLKSIQQALACWFLRIWHKIWKFTFFLILPNQILMGHIQQINWMFTKLSVDKLLHQTCHKFTLTPFVVLSGGWTIQTLCKW